MQCSSFKTIPTSVTFSIYWENKWSVLTTLLICSWRHSIHQFVITWLVLNPFTLSSWSCEAAASLWCRPLQIEVNSKIWRVETCSWCGGRDLPLHACQCWWLDVTAFSVLRRLVILELYWNGRYNAFQIYSCIEKRRHIGKHKHHATVVVIIGIEPKYLPWRT